MSKSSGVISYKENKVTGLKEYLGTSYESFLRQAYFYADSIDELALFEEVAFPVVCNGDKISVKLPKKEAMQGLSFNLLFYSSIKYYIDFIEK